MGFAAPERQVWRAWCYRQLSGERFRLPGFGETGPIVQANRLASAEAILEALEAGRTPEAGVMRPVAARRNLRSYYQEDYDRLAERAAHLRQRVRALRLPENT